MYLQVLVTATPIIVSETNSPFTALRNEMCNEEVQGGSGEGRGWLKVN